MRIRGASAALAVTLAIGGALSVGCGGDDDFDGASFVGNVSSVDGQSSCAAPSGDLLFCVDEHCRRVDGDDCHFAKTISVADGGPIRVVLRFVDDADGDGDAGNDEANSIVNESLEVCSGDQILVADAAVDFGGASSATISKTVDNCDDGAPIPTNTPGGPTPTASRTPTRTPTYGVAMNDAPQPMLVFFASLGLIGLLIPRRRRGGHGR